MPDSASKKLSLVKEIITDGKMEDALQLIKDIEQMENLNLEETLKTLAYSAKLYAGLGQYTTGLKFAEELYHRSQEMSLPFFSLDALFIKGWMIYIGLGRAEDYIKTIEQYEYLFNSLPREDSPEYLEREVVLLINKGGVNYFKGNLDLAIIDHKKSKAILKKINPNYHFNSEFLSYAPYGWMAYTYEAKGELKLALECAEKALSLTPKGEFHLKPKGDNYRIMGNIYLGTGDLQNALECQTRALNTYKKIGSRWEMGYSYGNIIAILVSQKNVDQAKNYLEEFKQFVEKYKFTEPLYQASRAVIIYQSPRRRDRGEAETILKRVIEESSDNTFLTPALIGLCHWYFEEFRVSNQIEVLDDIRPLIDQLLNIYDRTASYSLLANVKLLQAKLALLQINMVEARKLLTEAQQIAEDHDLNLLAGEISKEHDKLLEELKLWESFKKEKASVADRIKLASVDAVLERMQGRRAIEAPEIINEEPILLIIMGKEGVSYFNHSFIQNWDFDDLFSAFMSAFNTFSSEIFSKSIDRIKIDENVILIKPIEPYLICYVIKGQSYPAQKKLTRFSDSIRNNSEIWEALNKAAKTNEMLELTNPPSLGSTLNEIFIR